MPCNDVWGVREVGGGGSTGLAVSYGIPDGDCTRVDHLEHSLPRNPPQTPLLLRPCNDASLVGEPHSSGTRAESFYERLAGRLRPALKADPALGYSAGLVPETSISAYCRSFGIIGRDPSVHIDTKGGKCLQIQQALFAATRKSGN